MTYNATIMVPDGGKLRTSARRGGGFWKTTAGIWFAVSDRKGTGRFNEWFLVLDSDKEAADVAEG